jgi:hypothetical protein
MAFFVTVPLERPLRDGEFLPLVSLDDVAVTQFHSASPNNSDVNAFVESYIAGGLEQKAHLILRTSTKWPKLLLAGMNALKTRMCF